MEKTNNNDQNTQANRRDHGYRNVTEETTTQEQECRKKQRSFFGDLTKESELIKKRDCPVKKKLFQAETPYLSCCFAIKVVHVKILMRTLVGFSLNFCKKPTGKPTKTTTSTTWTELYTMAINYGKIKHLKTCGSIKDLPDETLPEIVLAGRSNVGKSSLVNALGGNRKLARVSQTPGKTQQIIYFDMDSQAILADLPGYGYSKASKDKSRGFSERPCAFADRHKTRTLK